METVNQASDNLHLPLKVITLENEGEGYGMSDKSMLSESNKWAGRWGEFYASQKHPKTWRLRKIYRNIVHNLTKAG
jgi:hypothetical protein